MGFSVYVSDSSSCLNKGCFIFPPVWLYVTMIMGSVAIGSACPLYYELACELSYPVAEGLTNGVMTWLNNVAALIFYFILMAPIGKHFIVFVIQ